MNETILASVSEEPHSDARRRAIETICYGGLAVGVLDGLAASINTAVRGKSPAVVWQYVASGLLGSESFKHGWKTVLLGLSIHFLIAFSVSAVYYAASLRLPVLLRQPFIFGPLYGVAVYFVMGYIVSPLSATAKLPFSFSGMVIGILIHIFCVGLPIALIARRIVRSDPQD